MKFIFNSFSCDVEIFNKDEDKNQKNKMKMK
jgi:hypothetical protein